MAKMMEFARLRTGDRWLAPGWLEVDAAGKILRVLEEPPTTAVAERLSGAAIPGIANLHSHAFQRAMAGFAERQTGEDDSFWTWRQVMYSFLSQLGPDDVEAIAAQLYTEMVKAGYTAVAEFHYLHHQPDGTRYGDAGEMSHRLIAAAKRAGIAITLLPVLYMNGGFGGVAPTDGQRRFILSVPEILKLIDDLKARYRDDADVNLGLAIHSLRAVTPPALADAIAGMSDIDPSAPIHIHIAEQLAEVEQSVEWCGQRPVAWLLNHVDVDNRWCLIHATHMTDEETTGIAAAGAIAGLCPTTEANLGDGLFPLQPFLAADGGFGIGSDSHVSISPVEELRWLEYGQRLIKQRRNVAATVATSTGTRLYLDAARGGAAALGRGAGEIAAGQPADIVLLDEDHPTLVGLGGDQTFDGYLFSGNTPSVKATIVGGRPRRPDASSTESDRISTAYAATLRRLAAAL